MFSRMCIVAAVSLSLAGAASAAIVEDTFTYSVTERLGDGTNDTNSEVVTNDNWAGTHASSWFARFYSVSGWTGKHYLRNDSGVAGSTITRANDTNWGYEVLPGIQSLSLDMQVRVYNPTTVTPQPDESAWIGLSVGGSLEFGLQIDGSGNLFVIDNDAPNATGHTLANSANYRQIRLDVDLSGATPVGAVSVNGTTVASNLALNYNLADLLSLDSLYVSTNDARTGPSIFTITTQTIPEPASLLLLSIGAAAFLRRPRSASR